MCAWPPRIWCRILQPLASQGMQMRFLGRCAQQLRHPAQTILIFGTKAYDESSGGNCSFHACERPRFYLLDYFLQVLLERALGTGLLRQKDLAQDLWGPRVFLWHASMNKGSPSSSPAFAQEVSCGT